MKSSSSLLSRAVAALSGCVVGTVAKTAVDVVTLPGEGRLRRSGCRDHQPVRSRREARAANCASRTRSAASRRGDGRALPQGPSPSDGRLHRGAAALSGCVRYFLDTEYNGFGGALLSLALVPDDGDELYLTLKTDEPIVAWVERHVVPYLDTVPEHLVLPAAEPPRCGPRARAISAPRRRAVDLADWPEDIAQFCNLMITGEATWSNSATSPSGSCR